MARRSLIGALVLLMLGVGCSLIEPSVVTPTVVDDVSVYATPLPTPAPLGPGADVVSIVLGDFWKAAESATQDSRPVVAQRAQEILQTMNGKNISWGGKLAGIKVIVSYEVIFDPTLRIYAGSGNYQLTQVSGELFVQGEVVVAEPGWRSLHEKAKPGIIWVLGEDLERAAAAAMTARELARERGGTPGGYFSSVLQSTELGTKAYTLGVLLAWHDPSEYYHPLLQNEILPDDHFSLWDIFRWVFNSQGLPRNAPTKEEVEGLRWDLRWELDERGLPKGLWKNLQFPYWAAFVQRLFFPDLQERELRPPPSASGA